jgi:hypothetical protein
MRYRNFLKGMLILILLSAWLGACSGVQTGPGSLETAAPPKPVSPKPGATLSGTIKMDNAESAQISLTVSADGQAVEAVELSFTNLKCEGFSAGSSFSGTQSFAPIMDGKFEFNSSDGVVNGEFKTPASAEGTIHVVFNDGLSECGTWEWSAAGE